MKKYIVVGGNGFIGGNMVNYLKNVEPDCEIIIIDDYSTSAQNKEKEKEDRNRNITYLCIDISKFDNFHKNARERIKEANCLFNFAAKARVQPSIQNCLYYHDTNVNGTLNLLNVSLETGVQKFVYSSSSSVYGNTNYYPTKEIIPPDPMSPYALQKLIGEQYCILFSEVYKMPTVSLRYFNVYGEGMPLKGAYTLVMGNWINSYNNGKDLKIYGDGYQRRDFTYIQDVVKANYLSYKNKKVINGEVFNIGNGNNRSVNDIAKVFKEILGCNFKFEPARYEPKITYADNEKARIILGWKPKGQVINWLRHYLTNKIKK